MAKGKTLEEQIAEHEAAIKKLREDAAAESVNTANERKSELVEALAAFNEAAGATGGRIVKLRLISDAERATGGSGQGKATGGKRLRLKDDQVETLKTEMVKAAKRYKSEGASRKQIIEQISSSNVGLVDGQHYNDGFVTRFLADLKADGKLKQEGEKSSARYVAL